MTLLEVMIAASMAVVLLTGVWSLLGTYTRLYEKGIDEVQRHRVVCAVTQQFSRDMRQIIFIPIDDDQTALATLDPQVDAKAQKAKPDVDPRRAAAEDLTAAQGAEGSFGDPSKVLASTRTVGKRASAARVTERLEPTATDSFPLVNATGSRPIGLRGTATTLELDVVLAADPYLWAPPNEPERSYGEAPTPQVDQSQAADQLAVSQRPGLIGLQPTRRHVPFAESVVSTLARIKYRFTRPDRAGPYQNPRPSGLERRRISWELAYSTDGTGINRAEPVNPNTDPTADGGMLTAISVLPLDDSPSIPLESHRAPRPTSAGESEPTDGVDRIEQIERLEFRYYDGLDWHSWWDSRSMGSLPVAVEVAFDVGQPSAPRKVPDGAWSPEAQVELTDGRTARATGIDRTQPARNQNSREEPLPPRLDPSETRVSGLQARALSETGLSAYWIPEHRAIVYLGPSRSPTPRAGPTLEGDGRLAPQ